MEPEKAGYGPQSIIKSAMTFYRVKFAKMIDKLQDRSRGIS